MLVLSRRPDDSIIVDGPCVVTILRIEGNKVRVGISAPGSKIMRHEIYDAAYYDPTSPITATQRLIAQERQ